MDDVSRGAFIAALGTAAAATTASSEAAAETFQTAAAPPARRPALGTQPEAYQFFTAPEASFVEAAADRLIPADKLGPGGRQAGVAYFIDQQLSGQFGYAAKMYMQGPWPDPAPTQGYQLPLAPREVYRLGIAATDAYCQKTYGKTFDKLSSQHQDDVLTAMDQAKLAYDSVPAKTFFEMLYANALEGFFADPMYGGNRDKAGWKLVGFPGAAAAYLGLVSKHNVPYKVTPMSVADLQQHETAMEGGRHSIDDMVAAHTHLGRKALGLE